MHHSYTSGYACAGMRDGNRHMNESVKKLPHELVIPNNEIHLLESIGQGELKLMLIVLDSYMYSYIRIMCSSYHVLTAYILIHTMSCIILAINIVP